jgi:hypothetical protein
MQGISYYCTTFGLCPACTIIFFLSSIFLLMILPILFPSVGVLSPRNERRGPPSCPFPRKFMPTSAQRPPLNPLVQASHQPHPIPPSRRFPSPIHQLLPPSPLRRYPPIGLATTTRSPARPVRLATTTRSPACSGRLLVRTAVLAWSPSFFSVFHVSRLGPSRLHVSSPFLYASWCFPFSSFSGSFLTGAKLRNLRIFARLRRCICEAPFLTGREASHYCTSYFAYKWSLHIAPKCNT